jgi:hypothetical protein
VPDTLHGTFSFKVLQNVIKRNNICPSQSVKACMFETFYVDSNSRWMSKVNSQMRKCHQAFSPSQRSNLISSQSLEEAMEIDEACFEDKFIEIGEEVETLHKFGDEIKAKKEQGKQRIMKEIQQRL